MKDWDIYFGSDAASTSSTVTWQGVDLSAYVTDVKIEVAYIRFRGGKQVFRTESELSWWEKDVPDA